MKLSQIIAYRESLDSLPFSESMAALTKDVAVCIDTLTQSPVSLRGQVPTIQQVGLALERDMDNFRGSIDIIKRVLDEEINDRSKEYFSASYAAYESIKSEPIEMLLNRELRRDDEGEKLLRHRIKLNSNWKYPGMLIRTQKEDFYTEMVDSDPLYLLDTSYQLLEPCLSSVTPNYRARLRTGMIDETHDRLLPSVPRDQLGFAFAWNFFNYRPIEIMRRYFQEIYETLRPGGVFIFTYNNCTRSMPVVLCEHSFASFTPDWAVKSLLNTIGYEVIDQYDGNYHLNFLEVRKPGTLTTMRGGQTLAVITAKPYTRARMQELREQAVSLELDLPDGEIDYASLERNVNDILERKRIEEQERLEKARLAEEQRLAELERLAAEKAYNETQAKERRRQEMERRRLEQEAAEKKRQHEEMERRIAGEKSIRLRADNLNIPDRDTMPFEELEKAVEHIEHMNELNHLRKEAVRLKLDRTDLIMRKYTLKELKRAIKQWRAENERPPT